MSVEVVIAVIAAVGTFLGGITKLAHWAVTRIAKSHDDAATKACAAQDRATNAIIDNTRITTSLVVKLDGMDTKLDEIRGVPKKKRHRTEPGLREGYRAPLSVVPDEE